MCTVLLPPGVNPTAVNKYIDIDINKPMKCKLFKLILWFGFLASSTCFEPSCVHHQENSLYTQFLYGMFFTHLRKQSSRWNSALERSVPPAGLLT